MVTKKIIIKTRCGIVKIEENKIPVFAKGFDEVWILNYEDVQYVYIYPYSDVMRQVIVLMKHAQAKKVSLYFFVEGV